MKILRLCALILAFHATSYGQVLINEICTTNGDLRLDPDYFDFSPFVELYNAGNSSANISNFYLSDDAAQKGKWRIPSGTTIPARGHLVIWCDSRGNRLHTNFSLDADGEELILSNSSQTEIDKIIFPRQYTNVTYGRLADGGNTIGFMVSPTPGANNNSLTGQTRLENPTLSLKSGRYSSSQSLTMISPQGGAEIRFTTDGSEPTAGSSLYEGPITIMRTTTIKATAFSEGFLPSKTEVKTYFINEHPFSLPVIAISGKPTYFFDNTIGILVDGSNGIPGNCRDEPVNWNQDWDRHAVFEYFDKTGEKILDQNVDVRVGGGCSRNNPQKSLVIRAKGKYGDKTIEYEFFKTKSINEFGGLMLRNGGNDFYYAMIRDGLMQSLTVGQMDIDYLAYEPAIVYLNGAYWGIQTIREKVDGDYIESNFGIDKSDVDIIETYGNAIEGTSDHYAMYLDSLQRIPLGTPEAYEFINRYVDVQELVNYFATQIYYANTDWPGNNIKFWRQRSTNGKFRWILWDLDFGMGVYQWASFPTHPTLDFATATDGPGWPNPPWSTLHLRLLLQIPEFRNKIIQTLTTSLNSTFKPDRVVSMINTFQDQVKTEMPYHVQRWQISMDNWNFEVDRLRLFAQERNDFMKGHIASFFGLQDNVRINVSTFPSQAGTVQLNGITTSGLDDAFYYKNIPFEAIAQPAAGFSFSHFKVRKKEAARVNFVDRNADWKYNDQGTLPAADWMNSSYSDAAWAQGQAELGYGDSDESTEVGYGGNPLDKYVTTYFRKTISVSDTTGFAALSGNVLFDDGVVIYLNGEEVFRSNMPEGVIGNSTPAVSTQNAETTFFGFTIPKGKIKPGANILAVEVHQNNNASSDISFNLDLSTVISGEETETTVNDIEISDIANSDVTIEAYFVAAMPSFGLVINEFSANNLTLEDNHGEKDDWIEIYNNGSETVDIGNYFLSDDQSEKLKHRIVPGKNSETLISPGAYKIIWADDDIEQGPLHVSFKLSDDGEELGLYQKVGALIETSDEVTFGEQKVMTSFSRIPNATGPFTQTASATPMAENIFELPTAVEEDIQSMVSVYPNPGDGNFEVRSELPITSLEIYNGTGTRVRSSGKTRTGEKLSLKDQPDGMYVLRIRVGGKVILKRVIKI